MAKVKSLSIQELIDEGGQGPVYVVNTSSQVTRGGDVFVNVEVGKTTRPLRVDRTWVPIELTKSVPRKSLLDSVYFMEAVSKGLLAPISREDAEAILKKPDAQAELRRIAAKQEVVKAEGSARGIGRNVTVSGGEPDDDVGGNVAKKGVTVVSLRQAAFDEEDGEKGEPTVSATFVGWVNKINSLTPDEAVNEIRIRGTLSSEECYYAIENCVHKRIQRGLRKKLGIEE